MTVGGVVFVLVVAALVVLIIAGYIKLVGLRLRSGEAGEGLGVPLEGRPGLGADLPVELHRGLLPVPPAGILRARQPPRAAGAPRRVRELRVSLGRSSRSRSCSRWFRRPRRRRRAASRSRTS